MHIATLRWHWFGYVLASLPQTGSTSPIQRCCCFEHFIKRERHFSKSTTDTFLLDCLKVKTEKWQALFHGKLNWRKFCYVTRSSTFAFRTRYGKHCRRSHISGLPVHPCSREDKLLRDRRKFSRVTRRMTLVLRRRVFCKDKNVMLDWLKRFQEIV